MKEIHENFETKSAIRISCYRVPYCRITLKNRYARLNKIF